MHVFLFTSFFCFPLPLIFALMEFSISHFLTAAIYFFFQRNCLRLLLLLLLLFLALAFSVINVNVYVKI